MFQRRNLIKSAILCAFIIGVSNNPSYSKNKMKMGTMTMSPEMMNMAMATMDNNKSMMMMGSKMIEDGNKAGDADKMMMGAKMLHMGMGTMDMGMMHMKMMDKKTQDMMMSKMNMTKANMDMMHKMMTSNANMLMNMGNSMMKSAGTDGEKMMKGSKMVKVGMMMHGHMMMEGKMDMSHMAKMDMDDDM
jgi:hypothetical protein